MLADRRCDNDKRDLQPGHDVAEQLRRYTGAVGWAILYPLDVLRPHSGGAGR